jgi:hypothetical protein
MERQRLHQRPGEQTLNRIIFDGHGGAKTAERWDVGHRIRDVEEGPDGSLWMLEDANPGALIHVTPQEHGEQPKISVAFLSKEKDYAMALASGLRKLHEVDNDDERKPDSRGDQPTGSGNRAGAGPCDDWRNVRVGLF